MADFGVTEAAIMMAVSTAMTVATTAVQYQEQANQANATNARNAQQQQLINTNLTQQDTQAQTQEQYVNNQAFQKLQANANAARAARATALTAGGEAGVSGNSVDALSREFYSREGDFAQSVANNRNADTERLQLQMAGFGTEAQSQSNQLVPGTQPSFLDAGLRIGAGAAADYGKYIYTPATPGTKITGGGGNSNVS